MMPRLMADVLTDPVALGAAVAPLNNDDLRGHEAEIAKGKLALRALPRRVWAWLTQRRTDDELIAGWSNRSHLMNDIGMAHGRGLDRHDR
jgi:hypothetical protein